MRLDAPLSGESALIERIAQRVGRASLPQPFHLLQGIGDDTAVLQAGDQTLLWTADMLVEGVHFRLDWIDPAALGWKSLAVNLSDIAAMGGTPVGALLSLALPAECTGAWLDAFVDGFADCAQTYGVALLGGDTNRAERVVIDVSVLGIVTGQPVLRSGAQVGDWLLVTGALGGSRAGLFALMAGKASEVDLAPHFRPIPRLQVGMLARELGATAMMDLSDGLAADLPKLLRASGVGRGDRRCTSACASRCGALGAGAWGLTPSPSQSRVEKTTNCLSPRRRSSPCDCWSASPPRRASPSRKSARRLSRNLRCGSSTRMGGASRFAIAGWITSAPERRTAQ
jgi:thiamine-monophosphate kinase